MKVSQRSCGVRRRHSIAAFVFAAFSQLSLAQTHGVFADRIVLAHIGPLDRAVLAASNRETLDASDLYLKKVNETGGVNGRKIVIERFDDNQDPNKTTEIARQIVEKKAALAFVLPRTSPSTEALYPIAEASNVPLIAPQAGTGSVTEPMKREVFAIRASYHAEVARALELQHSLGRRKFAFLIANDAFGNDIIKGLDAPMNKLALKPAGVERIDNRNPDVAQAVKKFAELKPEAVFFICAAKCGADFVKAYLATGNAAQFVAISNASNSGFLKELGDKKQGVVVMQVLPSPFSPKFAVSREYKKAAEEAKLPVTYNGMQGYLSARLIVEALKRTGRNPTPASLTAALEGMRSFDMGGFVVSFGPNERMGSKFVEATMISRDGRFIY
jgi:branched-chain amino acid transport system substrate-binding protein